MQIGADIQFKIAQGDREAFNILFVAYHPRVKNFILKLVKDESLSLDLAQDIFLNIWLKKESITEIKNLQAYFFQMAKFAVFDYFKTEKENVTFNPQIIGDLEIDSHIEEQIDAKELQLLIEIAIEGMPEQRKKIFKMSRHNGLSNQEIADKLQISKRTVETHISKALADIREVMALILLFFI